MIAIAGNDNACWMKCIVILALSCSSPVSTYGEIWEFTANWCGACRDMQPVVEKLVRQGIPIRQIDVDQHRQLVEESQVQFLPAFLVVDGKGRIRERHEGKLTAPQLVALWRRHHLVPEQSTSPDHPLQEPLHEVVRGQSGSNPGVGSGQGLSRAWENLRNRWNQGAAPSCAKDDCTITNSSQLLAQAGMPVDRSDPGFPSTNQLPPGPAAAQSGAPPNLTESQHAIPGQQAACNQAGTPPGSPSLANATLASPHHERGSADAGPVNRAVAATVRIRVKDANGVSLGTGTIIDVHDDEALILTCAHIFRDSHGKGEIVCDLFGGNGVQNVPGKLISRSERRDVGLISLRPGIVVDPVKVAGPGVVPKQNDRVFSVGCNRGQDPTLIQNRVLNVNKYHGPANLVVGGRPVDGRSGGGLFDQQGRLIGVCNAADPELDEGLYAALGPIRAELDEAGLSFIYRPTRPSLARTSPSSGTSLIRASANSPLQLPLSPETQTSPQQRLRPVQTSPLSVQQPLP